MKRNRGLLALFGSLTALALASFALVSLGSVDTTIIPSTLNSNPGGALGLYRLLEETGIPVERAFAPPTKQNPRTGVIVLFDMGFNPFGGRPDIYSVIDDYSTVDAILIVKLPRELPTRRGAATYVPTSTASAYQRITRIVAEAEPIDMESGILVFESAAGSLVTYQTIGERTDIVSNIGAPFLNRFLATEDNPDFCVSLVSAFLEPGKSVVFPEYALGIRAPETIFSKLGPSFSAGLIQLLFVFALLVYTLGKRFGYPDYDVPRKPGTSDFISALGQAFQRGRCTDVVLETAYGRALRLASRKLQIGADADEQRKLMAMPEPLRSRFLAIRDRADRKPSEREASSLMADLEEALSDLLSQREKK